METKIPSAIVFIASWLGMMVGFLKLFGMVENTIRAEVKTKISNWLKSIETNHNIIEWPNHFIDLFDEFFGEKHLSGLCFKRSSIVSFISVGLIFLLWAAIKPNEYYTYLKSCPNFYIALSGPFSLAVLYNLIPDYISLIETRYLLNYLQNTNSILKICCVLIIDLLVTGLIFILFMISSVTLYGLIAYKVIYMPDLDYILKKYILMHPWEVYPFPLGFYFYTTFFTSIWLWLYGISAFLIKTYNMSSLGSSKILKILDIENKPMGVCT